MVARARLKHIGASALPYAWPEAPPLPGENVASWSHPPGAPSLLRLEPLGDLATRLAATHYPHSNAGPRFRALRTLQDQIHLFLYS